MRDVVGTVAVSASAPSTIPDKRLELLFTCSHPAIDGGVRSPLMLQAVLGVDAAGIASAFLVSPAAMGRRLVRAKAKIKAAGIPFAVPGPEQLPERLEFVLDAVHAAYGTGWDDPTGARGPPQRMAAAEQHLSAAAAHRTPGPYQLHAAIQSVHNRRAVTGVTDWASIAALHDSLVAHTPSIGAQVARAAAHMQAGSPADALRMLDGGEAPGYQPYWVVRAHCLHRTGADPAPAARVALGLTEDPAVRRHLAETFGRW